MRIQYAIVFVSDMRRAAAFYRDTLGLPLRFESPGWTEFATQGATLALHAAEAAAPVAGGSNETPAGQCQPGFGVPDLDAFHRRMTEHGVNCIEAPKSIFGARIARNRDPDGLAISVSEVRGTSPQAT
ncbi:MAG TPA: VOC family protein [Casimicrobiaceae bacterium]|jgi:catechol 2,3-dioxygenase-like lactoylglutathione lyase family enzyme